MVRTFMRYLVVQVLAYGVDMGTFLLASTVFAWRPVAANVLAKILAGAFAFLAHRRITFETHGDGAARSQLLRYVALLALNVPLASGILALLLPLIGSPVVAKVVADCICVGITFLLSRSLVFTAPGKDGTRA